MSKLLLFSAKEVCKALEKAGFVFVGQRGSHIKYKRRSADRSQTVIIPSYHEIPGGTFKSILKQAGLSIEEFIALLK